MNQVPQPGGAANAAGGENNLVVARYRNGQVVKGYTRDFFPDRPLFHVLPKGGQTAVPIKTAELKGVFFVRDLVGNRVRNKGRRFPAVDQGPQTGRRIAVLFEDGELLVGYAQTWNLAVQQTLPWAMSLEVGYLATKGTRLDLQRLSEQLLLR